MGSWDNSRWEEVRRTLSDLCCRIAVSEKGGINLRLQVNMTPGHSSAPPKETSIGILAAAISR